MRREAPKNPRLITKEILDKIEENEKDGKIEFIQ